MKREKLRRFSTHKSCILSYPFNIGMKNSFWFLTWRWFSSLWAEERAEMKSSFCEIFAQRVEMHIKLIPNGYYSLQHDNIRYYIGIGREHLQHKSNIWHNFVTQDVFDNFSSSFLLLYLLLWHSDCCKRMRTVRIFNHTTHSRVNILISMRHILCI